MNKFVPPAVYIHIPFCVKKCSYCDFYSLAGTDEQLRNEYVKCLMTEIKNRAAFETGQVNSVYLGGGTPSLLSDRQISAILEGVDKYYRVSEQAEITMEMNPAVLLADRVESYKACGVNRFSLGVQSFDPRELGVLGRIHGRDDIFYAVEKLHKAGADNLNLDLIYGVPGQTLATWSTTLKTAVECSPAHISAYLLQLEPHTRMAEQVNSGSINLPGEEIELQMYELTQDYLSAHGFEQYEISNYARPGFESRHNLTYWQAYEYLGMGCGAVSYTEHRRYLNRPDLAIYMESIKERGWPASLELEHMPSIQQRAADALILGLRLNRGVDIQQFAKRFEFDIINEYKEIIEINLSNGLLEISGGFLKLTRKAHFISNRVLSDFIL